MSWETHSHTPLCRHAFGSPTELAAAAHQGGLQGIIFTCHGPLPDGISANVRMRDTEFPEYLRLVEEARQHWAGTIDVRLGLESDFLPGLEPWIRSLHQRADFHYILGSVHPQLAEYQAAFWSDDWREFSRTYFRHLADAAETGLYDCLAHPDLVKNLVVSDWDLEAVWPDILESLDRIAATGTAMELNT
jgi:histidinol-phosphatase (PHP family)